MRYTRKYARASPPPPPLQPYIIFFILAASVSPYYSCGSRPRKLPFNQVDYFFLFRKRNRGENQADKMGKGNVPSRAKKKAVKGKRLKTKKKAEEDRKKSERLLQEMERYQIQQQEAGHANESFSDDSSDFSSVEEDSFIVYSEEEDYGDELGDVLDRMKRTVGSMRDKETKKSAELEFNMKIKSIGAEKEPPKPDPYNNPQAAVVKRRKRLREWKAAMEERDKKRRKSRLTGTPRKKLVNKLLGFTTPPFFHQLVGLAWCMLREEMPYLGVRGGFYADDMGAGKTFAMLSLIAMDKICGYAKDRDLEVPHEPPTLVVCPAALVDSWDNEVKKCFGFEYMQSLVLRTSTAKNWADTVTAKQILAADLVIISYAGVRTAYSSLLQQLRGLMCTNPRQFAYFLPDHIWEPSPWDKPGRQGVDYARLSKAVNDVVRDLSIGYQTVWSDSSEWTAKHFLFGYPWRRAVFDECTHFKNDHTKNFESVRQIDAERRWSLSGTPLENRPDELYAQLSVLGLTESVSVINSKKKWRSFINKDEHGCEIRSTDGAPTAHAIEMLKKKFLNVLVMRREIQTLSLNDPLSPYETRANADAEQSASWDQFVASMRQRRILSNNPNSSFFLMKYKRGASGLNDQAYSAAHDSDSDDDGDDDGDDAEGERDEKEEEESKSIKLALNGSQPQTPSPVELEQTRYQLSESESECEEGGREEEDEEEGEVPPQLKDLPGFYWEMDQGRFKKLYRRVNQWFLEGTGFSIGQLASASRSARDKMKELGHATIPADKKAREAIFKNISLRWPTGGSVPVWTGFSLPKPVLLLGKMNKLERAVYQHLARASKREFDEEGHDVVRQNKIAFRAITSCLYASADYRFPLTAAEFLEEQRGSGEDALWSDRAPSIVLKSNSRKQLQGEEAENLRAMFDETEEIPKNPLGAAEPNSRGNAPKKQAHHVPAIAPTKYRLLERYVGACPKDDKILVFSDKVLFFPQLVNYMEERGFPCATLCGSMTTKERERNLQKFKKKGPGGARVFILSLMLAKQGLNLQEANHVVFFMLWWNPAIEAQAERRVARPGQKKTVYFVRLALLDTIDEFVLVRAGSKTEMIDQMIGHDDGLIETGANFSRPEDNKGILLDANNWPKNETLDELLSIEPVDFTPDEKSLKDIRDIHTADGRINKRKLASVVIEAGDRSTQD